MPTLSRLSKHSNRSQNALVEPPAAAAGGGTGEAAPAQGQAQKTRQSQAQPQSQSQSKPPPNQNPNNPSQLRGQDESQLPTEPPAQNPNAGFSSSESSFADPRSPPPPLTTQDQQQQQQPPPPGAVGASGGAPLPPQHQIYGVSPDTAAIDSPVFDNRRHPDFVEAAVNRSQSQRYSTYAALPHQQQLQQQDHQYRQQAYGTASTSFDNLPITAGYTQPPQPAPEKKSKRGFIKGIFSGSSRSSNSGHHHQQQQHQQQPPPPPQGPPPGHVLPPQQNAYDNTGGLARRPSRRESGVPVINTRFSQQQNQFQPEHDWQAQGSFSVEHSPLPDVGEVEEYQYQNRGPESDRDFRSQESRTSTIRPVADEPESPYDEGAYHPAVPQQQHRQHQGPPPPHLSHQHQQQLEQSAPLSQPHAQAHQQDQTHRHDQAQYTQQPPPGHAQQQQQLPFGAPTPPTPYQQVGEPRLSTGHLGTQQPPPLAQPQPHHHQPPPQQNSETVSQVSHESPVTDPDQRSTSQQSAQASPAANYAVQPQDPSPAPNAPSSQVVGPQAQQSSMAPPSGAPPASRDNKAPPRGDVPGGPPPGYRHSNASMGTLNIPPGQPVSQNPAFRGDGTPRFESPGMDQGRHSPQPERDTAEGEKAFKDLCEAHPHLTSPSPPLTTYPSPTVANHQSSDKVQECQAAVFRREVSD